MSLDLLKKKVAKKILNISEGENEVEINESDLDVEYHELMLEMDELEKEIDSAILEAAMEDTSDGEASDEPVIEFTEKDAAIAEAISEMDEDEFETFLESLTEEEKEYVSLLIDYFL